jgi:hypothetical protein
MRIVVESCIPVKRDKNHEGAQLTMRKAWTAVYLAQILHSPVAQPCSVFAQPSLNLNFQLLHMSLLLLYDMPYITR